MARTPFELETNRQDEVEIRMSSEAGGLVHEEQVNPIQGDYLTKRETANLLRITVRTLESWLKRGWVPYLKIHRTVRLKRADVEAVLNEKFRIGMSPSNHRHAPDARERLNQNRN